MSVEIINIFVGNENIEYLKQYLDENIKNNNAKDVVMENLTESIFNFPHNELIEDNRKNLRRSTNVWDEVKKLNKAFIDDRISFVKSYDTIGEEAYEYKVLQDESLYPPGYEHLNDKRLFRYQDPDNIDNSLIPVQQRLSRGNTDREYVDELKYSEDNMLRHVKQKIELKKHNGALLCNNPQWIDF